MQNLEHSERADHQLAIVDLIWITAAAAVAIKYAPLYGSGAISLLGIYIAAVLFISGGIGLICKRLPDAMYWGSLTTFLAFIAVAGGGFPPHHSICVGWAFVGAGAGAICGIGKNQHHMAGISLSATIGVALMSLGIWTAGGSFDALVLFDVLCAGVIAGLLWPLVRFLDWFQARGRYPRAVLAAWLTLSICVGNALVPFFV